MPGEARLYDLAKVLRSKNAGPFELTLDIMFDDTPYYGEYMPENCKFVLMQQTVSGSVDR